MTPRWISECKGFQMSQNFFNLDHFEILSVHPTHVHLMTLITKGTIPNTQTSQKGKKFWLQF